MIHDSLGRQLQDAMTRKNFLAVMSLVREKCKISAEPDSCWEWFEPLPIPRYRYAYHQLPDGQQVRIHRVVAWALDHFCGELRDFPDVHHICANTNCVNPHHLRSITAKANLAEGNARAHLVLRAEGLNAGISTASGFPSVMSGKDRERQVRRQEVEEAHELIKVRGLPVQEACLQVGMSRDAYYLAVATYHPEWEKRSLTDFEVAVSARDEVRLLAHVAKYSSIIDGSNCRKWRGSTRQGFASWGTFPRQWYVNRIAVWAARGCPSDLALLPKLYRNVQVCQSPLCVNPNHWNPVTDFLLTVMPKIVSSSLAEIRLKMAELAKRDPDHPMLVDGWDAYLPTEFMDKLRR